MKENSYDDILQQPYPIPLRRPRMSSADRAAQFSPFAALTGHEAAIRETARVTEAREELEEDEIQALNERLQWLQEHLNQRVTVQITYFVPDEAKAGGSYVTVSGVVRKIDGYEKILLLENGTRVPLEQLRELESSLFDTLEWQ
jgi:hypothetical protein